MVAAAAPLTVRGRDHQTLRAGHRIGGTLLGLLTSAPLLLLGLDPLGAVIAIAVLQSLTEFSVNRNYGLALIFLTPMALLIGQLSVLRPIGGLMLDRLLETVIGRVVAVLLLTVEHWLAFRRYDVHDAGN